MREEMLACGVRMAGGNGGDEDRSYSRFLLLETTQH